MFNKQLTPKRREKVEKIIARGKQSFVWKRGVFGWGVSVWVIFTAWEYYDPFRTPHRLREYGDLLFYLFSLPIWLIGGYVWGLWMWWYVNYLIERQRK